MRTVSHNIGASIVFCHCLYADESRRFKRKSEIQALFGASLKIEFNRFDAFEARAEKVFGFTPTNFVEDIVSKCRE